MQEGVFREITTLLAVDGDVIEKFIFNRARKEYSLGIKIPRLPKQSPIYKYAKNDLNCKIGKQSKRFIYYIKLIYYIYYIKSIRS